MTLKEFVSVPLFGDSFFIGNIIVHSVDDLYEVSVPLFGDSFFIMHVFIMKRKYTGMRFRPLIRGFFFYF